MIDSAWTTATIDRENRRRDQAEADESSQTPKGRTFGIEQGGTMYI